MSIASTASSAAAATGVMIGALAAIPVAGPIAAAIAAIGVLLANVFSGCGQTCVEATSLANQAEPLLLQNLQQYMSAPVHYQSLQQAALNNFNLTWQALVSACSNPALGSAGQACITDRQNGSCAYKTSPGGWQQQNGVWTYVYPGANGSGSTCWNWFVGYYDPIANDPTVVANPAGTEVTGSGASTTSCLSLFSLLGIAEPCLGPIGAYTAIVGVVLAAMAMGDL